MRAAWCYSIDAESFVVLDATTREGATVEARACVPADVRLYIGECSWFRHDVFVTAALVLTAAREAAYDECASAADYPAVSEAAERELDALLAAWCAKHMPDGPGFFAAEHVREAEPCV